LQDGVHEKSALFKDWLGKLQAKYPHIVSEVRGKGLILGLQMSRDPAELVTYARENGLLVITCGTNTVRFVPALNIPNELIDEGMTILDKGLDSINR
jgi:acetylornithine aminotransferase